MQEGDKIPDFNLPTHDDDSLSLDDLRGKPFVLFAYPRANTKGCTMEACSIRDQYDELEDLGIRPIGISDDPPEDNKKFADDYNFQYKLLSDEEGGLLKKLGSYGEKNMYGKTFHGTFRHSFIVDADGTIRKIFREVDVENHAQEIIDAVNQLDL